MKVWVIVIEVPDEPSTLLEVVRGPKQKVIDYAKEKYGRFDITDSDIHVWDGTNIEFPSQYRGEAIDLYPFRLKEIK